MTVSRKSWPELAAHRLGRRFRCRPGDAVVRDFLGHVWRTGTPHTWPALTTTPHPKGDAPTIITRFAIPTRLRSGFDTRAPCSICSDSAPKFDEGFLVRSADGFLRIIGHECGHAHFGETYARAVKAHEDETVEAAAIAVLNARFSDLSRTLIEAATTARELAVLLDFRERAFSAITLTAVAAMRRARVGDQLTLQIPSGARDDKGRQILETIGISTVPGLDGLMPRSGILAALMAAIRAAAGVWIVERDDRSDRLAAMGRHEIFAAARALVVLDASLRAARQMHDDLVRLLSRDGLSGLSAWGRHIQCPKPFWIEVTSTGHVFLGKGLRPQTWVHGAFLVLPDPDLACPIKVE